MQFSFHSIEEKKKEICFISYIFIRVEIERISTPLLTSWIEADAFER